MKNKHYNILNVDIYSTLDEIKKSFRVLSIKYHPDTGGTPEKFIELKHSYDWLVKNHIKENKPIPKEKPVQPKYDTQMEEFTRNVNIMYDANLGVYNVMVAVPMKIATYDYIMKLQNKTDNGNILEFRISKGDVFPKKYYISDSKRYRRYEITCHYRIS